MNISLAGFKQSKPTTPSVEPTRRRISMEAWRVEPSRRERALANIRDKIAAG